MQRKNSTNVYEGTLRIKLHITIKESDYPFTTFVLRVVRMTLFPLDQPPMIMKYMHVHTAFMF